MSELKQQPSGSVLRVRKDDSKKIRHPTRSASLKTEMAKIVYRNQMQEKQTIEGSAVDQAALGTKRPIHRAAAIPKTVYQRIVLKRKKSVEKASPLEKPITVDYRDLSAERRRKSIVQQQPAPTPVEAKTPTPQERMKAEGKKALRRNLSVQSRRMGEVYPCCFLEAQTEISQSEQSELLNQLRHLTQDKWTRPTITDTKTSVIPDKASITDRTNTDKKIQSTARNHATVYASAERHIEIKTTLLITDMNNSSKVWR